MKMVLAIRERFRRNWYINSLEITKSYKSHDFCLSEDSGQFSLVFLLFLPFFFPNLAKLSFNQGIKIGGGRCLK